MALDTLLQALRRQAFAERERLLAEAADEAARLRADAATRLTAARAGRVGTERATLASATERQVAAARRTTRGAVLAARQRLLDRVFADALAQLPAAGAGDALRGTLAERLARALACAGTGAIEVRCPAALVPELRRLAADRTGAVVRADPAVVAGLRVYAADGSVVVDDALEGHLERRRAELSLAVLADLAAREVREHPVAVVAAGAAAHG